MTEKKNLSCSFCGKNRESVDKLIAGPSVYICNECITLSYNIIVNETTAIPDSDLILENLPHPLEIKEFLDEYIVGHETAKELFAVSAYNHYKRVFYPGSTEVEIEKSNVLLTGPTGTGKTLFAKTLAKKLNVPFVIADATTLTEAGYVGEDVESVIERLLSLADWDIESAQRGIVYIDEVDKKARRSESNVATRDVSGEGVQQALLRLIEGTTIKVKMGNSRKLIEDYIEFDTSNVLFILGGAFVGIEKVIEKRIKKSSSIGFNATVVDESAKVKLLENVLPEDIIEYGLIPELVGRLPVLVSLGNLSEDQLKQVLTVKNNAIDQVKALLSIDNLSIEFSDNYYKQAASLAIKQKLGARSIKSIIELSVMSIMYRAPELQKNNVVKIIFDNYPILPEQLPVLEYRDGRKETDINYKNYRGINEKAISQQQLRI